MAWARLGDTFNSAKEFMAAAELAATRGDDRLVGELKGYTIALFTQSAVSWSDYKISFGAAVTVIGLSRVEPVLQDLMTIGVLRDVSTEDERAYMLVERKDFVHIIRSDEKKMAAKRRRDRNRGSLVTPVLLRDGDHCRYCGLEVNWNDRKNDDGGTFDHREPDKETTPHNYVVACRGCNQLRAELPDADQELPLLPPPVEPIYGKYIRETLSRWHRVTAKVASDMGIPNPLHVGKVDPRPAPTTSRATTSPAPTTPSPEPAGTQPDEAPRIPGHTSVPQGRAANETTQPGHQSGHHDPTHLKSPAPSDSQSIGEPRGHDTVHSRTGGHDTATPTPARKRRRRRARRRN